MAKIGDFGLARPDQGAIAEVTSSGAGVQNSPCCSWNARVSRCWKRGWSSIWFSTGFSPVASMIFVSSSGPKFETPMDRMRPSFFRSTRACHVST